MNFLTTVKGSLLEGFYPKGWDMARIDECCNKGTEREDYWHEDFNLVECQNISDFDVFMGHEIALQIKRAKDEKKKLALIVPVGPMGMYKWASYFLVEWEISCSHVYTFNMDEWSDEDGNTLDSNNPASFENSMKKAFFDKLGPYTVPEGQRHFATKDVLPLYADKLAKLKAEGAKTILIFGIGRAFHIAFWEPHFAEDFESENEWLKQSHKIGAKLHPLTIEQNAITSFKSRTTMVPCRANTIGPGVFMQADYVIGGADGAFDRGMGWQAMSFLTTLHYGKSIWIPSTYMPTMPGKLFFLKDLKGPLAPHVN